MIRSHTHRRAFAAFALLGSVMMASGAAQANDRATAGGVLRSATGEAVGDVALRGTRAGTQLTLKVHNIAPGEHGLHFHMVGRCDGPDFTTAGSHWNPSNHQHGKLNPMGPHAGDLRNLTVKADGTASFKTLLSGVYLKGGSAPMLDDDGVALVIHADPDDMKTDPSGNSGKRIACAVITAR